MDKSGRLVSLVAELAAYGQQSLIELVRASGLSFRQPSKLSGRLPMRVTLQHLPKNCDQLLCCSHYQPHHEDSLDSSR